MAEAPHHRPQPTASSKSNTALPRVDRLAPRPGFQEINKKPGPEQRVKNRLARRRLEPAGILRGLSETARTAEV